MSSSVYLSHTHDWTTHYLTACHYPTSDGTTSDDVSFYLPENRIFSHNHYCIFHVLVSSPHSECGSGEDSSVDLYRLLFSMNSLYDLLLRDRCMVSRRRVFDVP